MIFWGLKSSSTNEKSRNPVILTALQIMEKIFSWKRHAEMKDGYCLTGFLHMH